MVMIHNQGEAIAETDYWSTEHASRGLFYLSGNAGIWRLLVPAVSEHYLGEMRMASAVVIEPSQQEKGCWDLVFEDGSDTPFVITLDRRQVDREVGSGRCRIAVWTAGGLQFALPCEVSA